MKNKLKILGILVVSILFVASCNEESLTLAETN